MTRSPMFHPGELAVQERAGQSAVAARNASLIASTIVEAARPFIAGQFMVVLASTDIHGAVWSSVLYGEPGFVSAPSASVITIDMPAGRRADSDPFWANIRANPAVGMLFIDLGTRRRYRVNGTVQRFDACAVEVLVGEAYPNCPKYIQRRQLKAFGDAHAAADGIAAGGAIAGGVDALIRNADTVFVASHNAFTGADASHRGGAAGFVQIVDQRTLRIPDYHGNSLFNTFGNLALDPHIGLCIPDFAGQRLLHISGQAQLQWDQRDAAVVTGGTGRFLQVSVSSWILRQVPQRMEWDYLDASPFNLPHLES